MKGQEQERFWRTLLGKTRRDTTPFKEVLEQVKRSADADCGPQMMRRGYLKNGGWEDFKRKGTGRRTVV